MKKEKKIALLITIPVTVALIAGAVVFTSVSTGLIDTTDTITQVKRNYSIQDQKAIHKQSYQSLNEVTYQSLLNQKLTVSDVFLSHYQKFAFENYERVQGLEKNVSYSPLGLYLNLHTLSLGTNDLYQNAFEEYLCSSFEEREENYLPLLTNNFSSKETGSTQVYQGMFLTSDYDLTVRDDYLKKLTDHYVEAFSLSFHNDSDVERMLSWVNGKVNEKDFMTKEMLPEMDENEFISFVLYTTFFFQQNWGTRFLEEANEKKNFYAVDGSTTTKTFMNHTIYSKYYDYGDYCSVYDYYQNGYSIQYVTSLQKEQSIFDLVKGKNFLIEEEERRKNAPMHLSLPKFTSECLIDFTKIFEKSSLSPILVSDNNPFSEIYEPNDYFFSLFSTIQKNKVSFSEDGTIIKSVTQSVGKGEATSMPVEVIDVNLDHPFIYVIYDAQHLPVYIGQYAE